MMGGDMDPNPDAIEALFRAVANRLSNNQTKLAIWLNEEFDLSAFDYQRIGSKSPFAGSNSKLAGSGFLIPLQSPNLEALIDVLCDRLTWEIVHMEIESNGDVQFKAYDHFECILFGSQISLEMLEDLKTNEVIFSYRLADAEK
jgi:hypothetical protein